MRPDDGEEEKDNIDTVSIIKSIGTQLRLTACLYRLRQIKMVKI